MKYERRKPCGNCPFRCDVPLAHWHPAMYLMLRRIERTQEDLGTSTFGCHKDKGEPPERVEPCIGWLLNQRENGVHHIRLRIALAMSPDAAEQFMECEPDGEMFDTVEELVEANLARDREMNPHRYHEDGEYDPDHEEEDDDAPDRIATARRGAHVRAHCGEPATCFGEYETCDGTSAGYACDTCCGHGSEDGWCEEVDDA